MPDFNLIQAGPLTQSTRDFVGMAERSRALIQRDRQLDINQQQGAAQQADMQATAQEQQKNELRQQILKKAYADGGLDGAIGAIAQFDPEKAIELKQKENNLRKSIYDTDNEALKIAASKFAHTLVSADPETREHLFKNGAKVMSEQFGVEMGDTLNSDDFLTLLSLGREHTEGLSKILQDKDSLRVAGPGILKAFTPETQAAADSILGSMISGTVQEYNKEEARKDRAEVREDFSLGLAAQKENRAAQEAMNPKAQSPVGKLQADRQAALERGDVAAVAQLDDAIEKAGSDNLGESLGKALGAAENAQLDKQSIRNMQDSLIEKQRNLKTLNRINEKFQKKPELFLAQGKIDTLKAKVKDFFGIASNEDKSLLDAATDIGGDIGMFLSEYAKAVSGSAVAEAEMKRLKENLISKDMTPQELQTALNRLIGLVSEDVALLNEQIGSRKIGLNETGRPTQDRVQEQMNRLGGFTFD